MDKHIEINGFNYNNPLIEIKELLNLGKKVIMLKSRIKLYIAFLGDKYNPEDYVIMPRDFDNKSHFGMISLKKFDKEELK